MDDVFAKVIIQCRSASTCMTISARSRSEEGGGALMALPAPAPSAGLGKVPEGSRISVNTKVTSAGRVQAQDGAHHHRADLPSSQSRSSSVIVSTDHVGPDIRRFIVTGSRTKATKLDVAIVVFACYALLRQVRLGLHAEWGVMAFL